MKPEDKARQQIDKMLEDSGWIIQDYGELNLGANAVREFPISKDNPDYALFIDRQSVGVVEAKKVGWTLTGVTTQSEKYIDGLAEKFPNAIRKPPFLMKPQELKQHLQIDVILIIVLVKSLPFIDQNYYKHGLKKKKHYVQDLSQN